MFRRSRRARLAMISQREQIGAQENCNAIDLVSDAVARGVEKSRNGFVHGIDLLVDPTARALYLLLDLTDLVAYVVSTVRDGLGDVAIGVVNLVTDGRAHVAMQRV